LTVNSSRQYQADSDLESLIGFITEVRPPHRLADYPSPIDLRELLALPANRARTRLWLNEKDRIIGYGLVDHFNNILFDVLPGGNVYETYSDILDWAEEAIRAFQPPSGLESLDTNCHSEDNQRIAVLLVKGFVQQNLSTHTLVRNLRDTILQPVLPQGWTIRPVKGEIEVHALVALHRASFGTDNLTIEERLSWMGTPHYTPDFDIVLETNLGDLAGYCMCGIEREANEITGQSRGYTDPVAVHPKYHGMGVAKALISRGMVLLADHGITEAVLNTSSDNVRMLKVASSLGYVVESSRVWYSKALA